MADPDSQNDGTQDEAQIAFRKRARRRLVGAVFLAILAAIILPLVMERSPPPTVVPVVRELGKEAPGKEERITVPAKSAAVSVSEGSPPVAAASPPQASALPTPPAGVTPPVAVAAKPPAPPNKAASVAKPVATAPTPAPAATTATAATTAPAATAPAATAAPAPAAPVPAENKEATKNIVTGEKPATQLWVMQVGLFSEQANAQKLTTKLRHLAVPSYIGTTSTPKGQRFVVRAGPFKSRAEAEAAQGKIRLEGLDVGRIVEK